MVVPVSLRYKISDGSVFHEQLLLEGASTRVNLKGKARLGAVNEVLGVLPRPLQRRAAARACSAHWPVGRQESA